MVSKLASVTFLGLLVASTATNSSYGSGDSYSADSYGSSGDSYSYGGSYAGADYHTPCHEKSPGAACTVTFNSAVVLEGVCSDVVPSHSHQDGSYGDAASYGAGDSYGSSTQAGSYGAGGSYGSSTQAGSYGAGGSYGSSTQAGSYGAGDSYGSSTTAGSYGAYGSGSYGTALYCNAATSSSKGDDGLGGGAIAGIAIGVVVGVLVFVGAAVYCLVFKKKAPAFNGESSGNQNNALKADMPPQMSGVPEPTQIPGGEV